MSSETFETSQWMAEFHFPCLDSDFWIGDWVFTEKKCILHLMVSTYANTAIVSKYISAQKQLLWFCLSYSVIEETNKGKS